MIPLFFNYEYSTEEIHAINYYANEPDGHDGIDYEILRTTYKPNPDGTVQKESKYV